MSNEITEENFEILFDEEINVVEIRYQGVNATLLAALQAEVDGLADTLNDAISGSNGQLGTLANQLDSLSTLVEVLGQDLALEQTARGDGDTLLGAQGAATATDLAAQITDVTDTFGAAIIAEAVARNAAIASANATIVTDVAALSITVSGLATNMGAAQADIIDVSEALSTETSARAAQYSALQADFGDTNAAVLSESVARADADTALAIDISVVSAEIALKNKTYYQTTAPSSGMIAGDLWFDTDDANRAYRYDGTTWVDVTPATSGNKTYYQTTAPSSGMTTGDVWFDSDDNNKQYRYDGSSWIAVDDQRIATISAAVTTEASARATADTALASDITTVAAAVALKNKTFYQTGAPSSGMIAGDLWFDTDDDNRAYCYDGTTWVDVTPAASGNKTYYQTTAPSSGMMTGDIWFDSDDGNKEYRYSGSSWDAVDDSRIATISAAVTSEASARVSGDAANASSISSVSASLATEVSNRTAGDATNATDIATASAAVVTEASARVAADGVIEAKYSIKVDVNGHVSGFGLISTANNATPYSEFVITADAFKIFDGTSDISPFTVTGGVVYMNNVVIGGNTAGATGGRITWSNGTYMKVIGVGFGSTNQFIEWYGPYFSDLNDCTEVGAIQYLKVNGDAYFGGSLMAGTLTNQGTSSSLAPDAEIVVGPFGTVGGSKSVTHGITITATTRNAVYTPTYPNTPHDPAAVTVKLYRTVGVGGEVEIDSHNLTASMVDNGYYGAAPGGGSYYTWTHTISGSWSTTDTTGGTDDFTYRVAITSRTNGTTNGHPYSGFTVNSQRVSVISVET